MALSCHWGARGAAGTCRTISRAWHQLGLWSVSCKSRRAKVKDKTPQTSMWNVTGFYYYHQAENTYRDQPDGPYVLYISFVFDVKLSAYWSPNTWGKKNETYHSDFHFIVLFIFFSWRCFCATLLFMECALAATKQFSFIRSILYIQYTMHS